MEPTLDLDRGADVRRRPTGINIPSSERVATIALGAIAVLAGLRRRSLGGLALALAGAPLVVRGILGRCAVYRTLADQGGVELQGAVTIQKPRAEVYAAWRRLDNVPHFLDHVQQVIIEDDRVSHWLIEDGAVTLEWIAELVEDIPDRRLVWQSVPGSDVDHEGVVDLFDTADGGTEVRVALRYQPPAGTAAPPALDEVLGRLTGTRLDAELQHLRQLLEAGDGSTGAPRPPRRRAPRKPRPPRPAVVASSEAPAASGADVLPFAPIVRGEA